MHQATPQPARLGPALALALGALASLYLAGRLLLPAVGREAVEAWRLSIGLAIFPLAAAACFVRARSLQRDRAAWALCGIAVLCYPLGTLITEVAGTDTATPLTAHAAWLLFYGCLYAAVSLLGRSALRPFPSALLLDGVLAVGAIGAALALLLEIVGTSSYRLWEAGLGIAYPSLDLVLLGYVVWIATAGRTSDLHRWRWLVAAMALMLGADLLFVALAYLGSLSSVALYTAGYPVAVAAIGIASQQPPAPPVSLRAGMRSSGLTPGVSIPIALAVLAVGLLGDLRGPAPAFAIATLLLAFVRGALVYRDLSSLQESRRFERGFEEAGIGMALVDREARWVRVNPALAALLGSDPDALAGRRISDFVAPETQLSVERVHASLLNGARRITPTDVLARRADDSILEVLISGDLLFDVDGDVRCFLQVRDVTAARRAERFSSAVARLARAALVEGHVDDLLHALTSDLCRALGAELVAVLLEEDGAEGLRVIGPERSLPLRVRTALADGEGPIAEALTGHHPVAIGPIEPGVTSVGDALLTAGAHSALFIPVLPRRGLAGVICVGRSEASPGERPDEIRFVEAVADVVASALDRERGEALSRHQALHDPLTGLANRSLLTAHLDHALGAARRDDGYVGVVLLDLDRFKNINDTLGHNVGDALLCAVASRLAEQTRGGDLVARLGGDEFVVVFDRVDDAADMIPFVHRLIAALEEPISIDGRELFAGASMGVLAGAATQATPETLLRDADVAMYRAKENGGQRYALFDEKLRARIVRRTTTEHHLRHAAERGELRLGLQPQLALDGSGLVGFESLVRWVRPEHGIVAPSRFIHVAEETGLIVPMGQWVLTESCRWLGRLQAAGSAPLRISVNLSARQLTAELPDLIDEALERGGIEPGRLCLEITETLLVSDPQAFDVLGAIRARGVVLSLDDFGTGWSSLAALQRHVLDELKLDRSMVAALGTTPTAMAIARAAVDMASALGLTVVAEGIERPDQLSAARDLGCDVGQGFLFSEPLWPPAAERYVAQGDWRSRVPPA